MFRHRSGAAAAQARDRNAPIARSRLATRFRHRQRPAALAAARPRGGENAPTASAHCPRAGRRRWPPHRGHSRRHRRPGAPGRRRRHVPRSTERRTARDTLLLLLRRHSDRRRAVVEAIRRSTWPSAAAGLTSTVAQPKVARNAERKRMLSASMTCTAARRHGRAGVSLPSAPAGRSAPGARSGPRCGCRGRACRWWRGSGCSGAVGMRRAASSAMP